MNDDWDDWDELLEDINDGWSEDEIADMLDAGICPECGADLDICGHAELFEYTSFWLEIEDEDEDDV